MPLPPFPIPHPTGNEFINQGTALLIEEARRALQRRKREPVLSFEEKQELMRNQLSPNPGTTVVRNNIINIFFLDVENGDRLQAQVVPKLAVDPTAEWATIAPIGRNNPFYHYVGGEDSLSFRLNWYSDLKENGKPDDDRVEVIRKCRWLEARSRNNGFNEPPHRLKVLWGDTLFIDDTWIVDSARYDLDLFHKDKDLLPTLAYQDVILKRVADHNRTFDEITQVGRVIKPAPRFV